MAVSPEGFTFHLEAAILTGGGFCVSLLLSPWRLRYVV